MSCQPDFTNKALSCFVILDISTAEMKALRQLALATVFFCGSANSLLADEFENFTYEDMGTYIAITDYPDTAVGPVVIPATIAGKPVKVIEATAFNEVLGLTSVTLPSSVTTIGSDAFALCPALTSVSIPSSVTSIGASAFYECTALTGLVLPSSVTIIGEQAFFHCSGLTELIIPAGVTIIESKICEGCVGLTRVTLGGSVTTIRNDAFTGCHGLTNMTIPNTVSTIENYAFFDCIGLKSVKIPSAVTSIGNGAFDDCDALDDVFFLGDAPAFGETVFVAPDNNPDLTLYFYSGKSGFTAPFWQPENYQFSYKTESMGPENPAAPWLILNGLPFDSDLQEDSNHDGVSLLMAYALDLDPSKNLGGSLPKPVIGANQLGLSYYSGAPGITYTVEASTDLTNWTIAGVSVSAPDGNLIRTATVPVGTGPRFMRLMVEK